MHYPPQHHFRVESPFRQLGVLDLGSYYHNRVLRWAGWPRGTHANEPGAATATHRLGGQVVHPWPIACSEINIGRALKKALKSNELPTDFAKWSAIDRDKPRWRLLTHSTPTPNPPTPSSPTPNQPFANPNAPLSGYGNLAPAYVAPASYAPLTQAQYAETRAADRAAQYAARANKKNQRERAQAASRARAGLLGGSVAGEIT
jgi:hypothetical protein